MDVLKCVLIIALVLILLCSAGSGSTTTRLYGDSTTEAPLPDKDK